MLVAICKPFRLVHAQNIPEPTANSSRWHSLRNIGTLAMLSPTARVCRIQRARLRFCTFFGLTCHGAQPKNGSVSRRCTCSAWALTQTSTKTQHVLKTWQVTRGAASSAIELQSQNTQTHTHTHTNTHTHTHRHSFSLSKPSILSFSLSGNPRCKQATAASSLVSAVVFVATSLAVCPACNTIHAAWAGVITSGEYRTIGFDGQSMSLKSFGA